MEYSDHLQKLEAADPRLAAEIAPFRTLEQILKWEKFRASDLKQLDLIAQDEYSHDLLVPLPDGRRWLAFAMT